MQVSRTLFALLLGAAAPAMAHAAQPARADGGTQLEEVVVTAQKRDENLQSVPIAVSAVTAQQIAASGATATGDLQQLVPGLLVGKTTTAGQTYIRGVGQGSGVPGNEAAVATYLDGIYLGSTALGMFDLANVQSVSVLKGPQGTLFGRNATGGLIQVTTKDPQRTPSGDFELGYGNYKTWTGKLYVTGPLSENLTGSLAFSGKHRGEGYAYNVHTGNDLLAEKTYTGQAKLKWTPTDRTDVVAQYIQGNYKDVSGAVVDIYPGFLSVDGQSRYLGYGIVNLYEDPKNSSRNKIGSVKITHDLDWARLTSISSVIGYRSSSVVVQNSTPGTPNPNNVAAQITEVASKIGEVQQEINLQSLPGSSIQWIVGAFYFHDRTDLDLRVRLQQATAAAFTDRIETDSYSAFAQATKEILPGTRLTAGVRYTSDQRSFSGVTNTGATPPASVPGDKSWSEPTWRLALDHDVTPDILAYVSYNRGFKSGNYNNASFSNPPYDPEIVDAYEAGLKSELLDRRLRLNLSAFYMDYRNIQLRALRGTTLVVYNAAASDIKGFDADFQAAVTGNLRITGGFQILNAKYSKFPGGVYNADTPISAADIAALGCSGTPSTRVGGVTPLVCDLSGNRMLKSPKFSANLGVNYVIDTGVGKVTLFASDSYNSGWYGDPDNRYKTPRSHWINASALWQNPKENVGVRVWMTNLADSKIYDAIAFTTGATQVPGEPRMYGVTLNYSF